MTPCTLSHFLTAMETLAPLEGAAEWDNTGLLLEGGSKELSKVLLTLDLTPAVAREACAKNCQVVVSYHPPLFGGLDRLVESDPLQGALLTLIRAGIHLYSPHTALDAAPGGVSDWLADCFPASDVRPHAGCARVLSLKHPFSLSSLTKAWAEYLGCPYLRVAKADGRSRKIRTLALCPGAGASALAGLKVDAVLTGEMKHHDILHWQRNGTAVVLAEHGHTERPYLSVFRTHLMRENPNLQVMISTKDKEPLSLVMPNA